MWEQLAMAALQAGMKVAGDQIGKSGDKRDDNAPIQVPQTAGGPPEQSKSNDNTGKLLNVLEPLITGGSNLVTNQVFGKANAKAQGLASKAYNDAAHPGTNAWERLGKGNAGTPAQIAGDQQRTQLKMQSRDLAAKRQIAELQARTALQQTQMSTKAPLEQASIAQARLPAELRNLSEQNRNLIAQRLLTIQQAATQGEIRKVREQEALLAKEMTKAKLTELQNRTLSVAIANAAQGDSGIIGAVGHTVGKKLPFASKLNSAAKWLNKKTGLNPAKKKFP